MERLPRAHHRPDQDLHEQVMKVLALIVTTIFMPLPFIVGICDTILWFRRRGWL